MKQESYKRMEQYMKTCMKDSAHDYEHIYRVLYTALDIAKEEPNVDYDVLIAACLLHDIGREQQARNPKVCHAQIGGKMAYFYLMSNGWPMKRVQHVVDCIQTHRYHSKKEPQSIEAKILFDADKLDVAGAVGIARTLIYKGQVNEPLYHVDEHGDVIDSAEEKRPSFFQEYRRKLEPLYGRFYTERGKQLAKERKQAAQSFFESLRHEVSDGYLSGKQQLQDIFEGNVPAADAKAEQPSVPAPEILADTSQEAPEPAKSPEKSFVPVPTKLEHNYEWLDEFLLSQPGAVTDFKAEWQWKRYLVHGKMFAAICVDNEGTPIITVKCDPSMAKLLRLQYPEIQPGFYMNKVHWNSVSLIGHVPESLMREMAQNSYKLIVQTLPKKIREQLHIMKQKKQKQESSL